MQTRPLFVFLSLASLLVMIAFDYFPGAKAEFINAWSVIERLFAVTLQQETPRYFDPWVQPVSSFVSDLPTSSSVAC